MTQFPKLVCAFYATLFCAGTLTALAEDNAAQAAARAELLQELQQASAPQTNEVSSPAVVQAPAAAAPAVTAPAVSAPATPPPVQSAPAEAAPVEAAPATSGGDNPAQAAARALLLQQLSLPPDNSNPAAVAPAVGVAPAANTAAASPDIDANRQAKAAAEATREAKTAAKAKAAADAKAAAMAEAARNEAFATPTGGAAPKPSTAAAVGQQISVPAPPISADQAARLQALDAKYTANQISPVDYFNQREAILSGQ